MTFKSNTMHRAGTGNIFNAQNDDECKNLPLSCDIIPQNSDILVQQLDAPAPVCSAAVIFFVSGEKKYLKKKNGT